MSSLDPSDLADQLIGVQKELQHSKQAFLDALTAYDVGGPRLEERTAKRLLAYQTADQPPQIRSAADAMAADLRAFRTIEADLTAATAIVITQLDTTILSISAAQFREAFTAFGRISSLDDLRALAGRLDSAQQRNLYGVVRAGALGKGVVAAEKAATTLLKLRLTRLEQFCGENPTYSLADIQADLQGTIQAIGEAELLAGLVRDFEAILLTSFNIVVPGLGLAIQLVAELARRVLDRQSPPPQDENLKALFWFGAQMSSDNDDARTNVKAINELTESLGKAVA